MNNRVYTLWKTYNMLHNLKMTFIYDYLLIIINHIHFTGFDSIATYFNNFLKLNYGLNFYYLWKSNEWISYKHIDRIIKMLIFVLKIKHSKLLLIYPLKLNIYVSPGARKKKKCVYSYMYLYKLLIIDLSI